MTACRRGGQMPASRRPLSQTRIDLAFRRRLSLDVAQIACFLLRGWSVRHPVDITIMFAALWLLGLMAIDILTPDELTIFLVALATGPAALGTAVCYFLQIPKTDFAIVFASLWLLAAMALEWISPAPLPDFMIGGALAPALIVGGVLHWRRCRVSGRPDKEVH